MHLWEKRFQGIAQEKKLRMLEELEGHIAPRGARLLSTEEVEKLLTFLPSDYFRLRLHHQMNAARKELDDFPEKFADFEKAVLSLTKVCEAYLSLAEDDEDRLQFLMDMGRIQIYHPALWFKVYKNAADRHISWATLLEDSDKNKRFLPI